MAHSAFRFRNLSSFRPGLHVLSTYALAHWQRYLGAVASVLALLLAASASDSTILPLSIDLPYYYFVLLRLLVCTVSAYSAVRAYKNNFGFWTWALGANAVLFNPVVPVRMERSDWAIVNLIDALFLCIWIGFSVLGDFKKDRDVLKHTPSPPTGDSKLAGSVPITAVPTYADQPKSTSTFGYLSAQLIATAEKHSKGRADEFLASKLATGNPYFEVLALELAAIIRATEDVLDGPLWDPFVDEYEKYYKELLNRVNHADVFDDRVTTYSVCYTKDRDGDGISTVASAFAYFCCGIYPDVQTVFADGFESHKIDRAYFEFGKETFLLAVDWSENLIRSIHINL